MDIETIVGWGIIGFCAWLSYVHQEAEKKKKIEYFGYFWDIYLTREDGKKKKTVTIQSVDARAFLAKQVDYFRGF